MQHRGQEAAGIASFDGHDFYIRRGKGLVARVFEHADDVAKLQGNMAIGHARYATSGDVVARNAQPLYADLGFTSVAIAHNGNLTNALQCRHQLVREGAIFQSTTDTEVIMHFMARAGTTKPEEALLDALRRVQGGYALVCLTRDSLLCVRDPNGIRPMVLGRLGESWICASETVGLDVIGADYVREVEAGEMIKLDQDGLTSFKPFPKARTRPCLFEYVYFARPDSLIGGQNVYEVRKKIGAELALEAPAEADIVVPVPDSGTPAAMGFARGSGCPFELGLIRSHYVGRSFIQPNRDMRQLSVQLKHNANRAVVKDKRVVLVDDSLVRGTTAAQIVRMVRDAGASEVHMRIASPPIRFPCFYGIDMPTREELLAHNRDLDQIRQILGVDSLAFLSLDGLYRALGEQGRNAQFPQYSDHYFTGDYPVKPIDYEHGLLGRPLNLPNER
ncbi:MAG: amidophosphoribosyltransferase [Pseudomonadota bacterium]